MSSSVFANSEQVGPAFTEDGMLHARQQTRAVVADIAAQMVPGMVEEDAVMLARQAMIDAGHALTWHPTRVRFGRNTIKSMKQPSEPGVVLGENDLFFIDIAPRVGAWEGDGGATFVVGEQAEYARCASDAETLFHLLRRQWEQEQLSGQALYQHADALAKSMGWELNFDLPGHRVSDFPHATIYTGSMAELETTPTEMRWILEIHLRDPQHRFGAFFEDMLLPEHYY